MKKKGLMTKIKNIYYSINNVIHGEVKDNVSNAL
jgi:hypothetical protein